MTQLLPKFDYSALDSKTAEFLRQKEENMRQIVGNAYTELGRELKEAQDELANHGYGCFEEWYTFLGFKKQSVYNYINRYTLIVQQLDKRDVIEELPLGLAYEIAKPSVNQELKQKVLDGEITSLKEYKKLESELKEALSRAERAESTARHFETLWKQVSNRPPQVVKEKVEVVPPDYETTKQKNHELEQRVQKLEIDNLNLTRAQILQRDRHAFRDALSNLVQSLGKNMKQAELEFNKNPDDRENYENLMSCIEIIEKSARDMRQWTEPSKRKGVVIDGNFTVVAGP